MLKKYPYLYEIPLFYALLFGINEILIPDIPGYIGAPLHPYWAGVLLFGFRYGVWAGVFSGIASAALYLVLAWFYVEPYLFEDLTFYLLPSLFIILGSLIGTGVEKYRSMIRRLRYSNGILQQERDALKNEAKVLRDTNQGLENRVVTRMTTLITLQEGARRLESFDIEDLYPSSLKFILKTLEAEEAALYLKADDGWVLKETQGWKEYHQRPSRLKLNEGLVGLAGSRGKIVTIRDFLQESSDPAPELMGDCLFAGPIRQGEKGEVIGVIAIQNMPFLNFNSATVNLFAFLLNWVSRAMARASYVQELSQNEIVDNEFQVFSHRYFQSRFDQEFVRSRTYYLPLSVGLIRFQGLSVLSETRRGACLAALSQVLKEACREMDVIARFPEADIPFAILLVTASEAQAIEIRRHILEHFERLQLKGDSPGGGGLSIEVGLSHFKPKTESILYMLEEARQDLSHEVAHVQIQSV